ncbi:MAG: glycosyltransferase family 87 protein [Pseudomonadota bacterium]
MVISQPPIGEATDAISGGSQAPVDPPVDLPVDPPARRGPVSPAWDRALCLAVLCGFVAWVVAAWWSHAPPDLMSTYIAGQLYRTGEIDALYLGEGASFVTEHPPWQAVLEAQGLVGQVTYPYVYPPLWAVLASAIPASVPAETVFRLSYALGALCIGLSALAAIRLSAPPGPRALWLAGMLAATLVVIEGKLTLHHCQPQIVVGLMILLAMRYAGPVPIMAGAALALAAAIKLYPALLALWWLAERRWRTLGGFALIGGALGWLSLGLAGWPLHEAFLERLEILRGELNGTGLNVNLENLLFQLAHSAQLPRDPQTGALLYFAAPDPLWISVTVPLILLCGLVLIAARWRAGDAVWRSRALFPAALILVSLSLPLGWAHQFLIVLYLIPALARLYVLRLCLGVALAIVVSHSRVLLAPLGQTGLPVMPLLLVGVLSYVGLFFLFALAPGKNRS